MNKTYKLNTNFYTVIFLGLANLMASCTSGIKATHSDGANTTQITDPQSEPPQPPTSPTQNTPEPKSPSTTPPAAETPTPEIPELMINTDASVVAREALQVSWNAVGGVYHLLVSRNPTCSDPLVDVQTSDEEYTLTLSQHASYFLCLSSHLNGTHIVAKNNRKPLEVTPAPLALSTPSQPSGSELDYLRFAVEIAESDEPVSFSCTECPENTYVNTHSGVVSWIPPPGAANTSPVSFKIAAASGARSGSITVSVPVVATSHITVTTTAIENPPVTNGNCSLIEAIQAAQTNAAVDACPAGSADNPDYIYLPPGTYHFVSIFAGTNALPQITSPLHIVGKSPESVILQRSNDTLDDLRGTVAPHFRFIENINSGTLRLAGLTLRGANRSTWQNAGHLTLHNVSIRQNSNSGHGGAGNSSAGSVTIIDGDMSNNTASCWAGAIKTVGGTQTMIDGTEFRSNETLGNCGAGGAILTEGNGSRLEAQRVVVDGNSDGSTGGQISVQQSATALITNTLIARAARSAVRVQNSGLVEIRDSHFLNNGWRAIYKSGSGTLDIQRTTFEGGDGQSAFYNHGISGLTKISDSKFIGHAGLLMIADAQQLQLSHTTFPEAGSVVVVDLRPDVATSGRTLNDDGDTDGLQNFPVIESAVRQANGAIELRGFAPAGMNIEFYESWTNANSIGKGKLYITTLTEGSADDLDAGSGMYGPIVAGASVGSDTTERFHFVITPGTLPLPTQEALSTGRLITLIGTLNGKTSEFGNSVTISDP